MCSGHDSNNYNPISYNRAKGEFKGIFVLIGFFLVAFAFLCLLAKFQDGINWILGFFS